MVSWRLAVTPTALLPKLSDGGDTAISGPLTATARFAGWAESWTWIDARLELAQERETTSPMAQPSAADRNDAGDTPLYMSHLVLGFGRKSLV